MVTLIIVSSQKNSRGNQNRKVEGRQDIHPDFIIKNCLNLYGERKLNEILNYCKSNNIKYTSHGLIKKLKSLESQGVITKITERGKHPRYIIKDTTNFEIQSDAFTFKDHIGLFLDSEITKEELNTIKNYSDNHKKNLVSELIFKFGLASLYTLLASYRRSMSKEHTKEKNRKLHNLWLKNAMAFEINHNTSKFSRYLEIGLHRLTRNSKDYSIEANKLEKIFAEMFPEFYKEFQELEKLMNKESHKEFMENVCSENPSWLLS